MGALNRLLLFAYSLLFLIITALGTSMALNVGFGQEEVVSDWLDRFYRNPEARWSILALSVLALVFSLRLLWISLQIRKEDPGVDRLTEFGHVRISLETLESLAVKAARKVQGIRDLSARVRREGDHTSIGIGLKLTVDGDTPIQTLSEQLQQSVKTYVEEIAGVDVSQISVYIADTVKPERSRNRVE